MKFFKWFILSLIVISLSIYIYWCNRNIFEAQVVLDMSDKKYFLDVDVVQDKIDFYQMDQIVGIMRKVEGNGNEFENPPLQKIINQYRRNIVLKYDHHNIVMNIWTYGENKVEATLLAIASLESFRNMKKKTEGQVLMDESQVLKKTIISYENFLYKSAAYLEAFKPEDKVLKVSLEEKRIFNNIIDMYQIDFMKHLKFARVHLNNISEELKNYTIDGAYDELHEEAFLTTFEIMDFKKQLLVLKFYKYIYRYKQDIWFQDVSDDMYLNEILNLKQRLVERLKMIRAENITPELESHLALVVKYIFLSVEQDALTMIIQKRYADAQSLTDNQKKFLSIKEDMSKTMSQYVDILNVYKNTMARHLLISN